MFAPKPNQQPEPDEKKPAAVAEAAQDDKPNENQQDTDEGEVKADGDEKSDEQKIVAAADEEGDDAPAVVEKLPQFANQLVKLGSDDPKSGYRLAVTLNSRGAAVEQIELIDPRYCSEKDRKVPLKVVGDVGNRTPDSVRKTRRIRDESVLEVYSIFQRRCAECHGSQKPKGGLRLDSHEAILLGGETGDTIIPGNSENSRLIEAISFENEKFQMPHKGKKLPDEEIAAIADWIDMGAPDLSPVTLQAKIPQIEGQFSQFESSLSTVDWELVSKKEDISQATFRMVSPDGKTEIRKTYKLHKVDQKADVPEASAYAVDFDFTVKNLSEQKQSLNYVLQGPVGLPLENAENARKFRDVKFAYVDKDSGKHVAQSLTSAEIADGEINRWVQPILSYIGVDTQYFAAFIQPAQQQQANESYFDGYTQLVVDRDEEHPERSDISVRVTSREVDLGSGKSVTDSYRFYTGPKREKLLAVYGAESIMDFGWFGVVSNIMLKMLDFFHSIIPNYGLAIILLTVVVRMGMFPLSRKQALGAAKMQEIKPEIDALKKKYGNDREKMGRAQMELFRKHKYNPLSGCWVLLIQLPIFLGLYQGLNNSVDLRMAPFLWIDNLAAPDALFSMPFAIPYLGDQFNLLPILTVILFVVQQKMFMPPATDEQAIMQQKMMMYMPIFMGFLFYKVPAGLCIYFITSSLWGVAERKLLPKMTHSKTEAADTENNGSAGSSGLGSGEKKSKAVPVQGAAGSRKSRPRR